MSRSTAANSFNAKDVHNFEEGLQIFHNPGKNAVYLTYDSQWADKGWIQIFDAQGRLVLQEATNSEGLLRINTQDWPKGLYALTLSYKGYTLAKAKLIKQ